MRSRISLVVAMVGLLVSNTARADTSWRARYEAARIDLVDGRYRRAEVLLRTLADEAPSEEDRSVAREMADLAAFAAARSEQKRNVRGSDELMLLYGSAFLYGAGSGTWFLLQAQPDSALTATLPFAAITAAPVIAIATLDSYAKLPRGLPHAISAGLYLGLAEGAAIAGYQNAKSVRVRLEDPGSEARWSPATTAGVLWTSATSGAVLAGLFASGARITSGRVSFTASTTLWTGAVIGLATGAVLPDDPQRSERAFGTAAVGLPAGLALGMGLASRVSPSVARVRLVDLLGAAGALSATGLYLSIAEQSDTRAAEGLAALGATAGLLTGWAVTAGMPKDEPEEASRSERSEVTPFVRPVRGGSAFGIGGSF